MKCKNLKVVDFAACMVLVVGLSASAVASCGDSLSAMAGGAALVQNQSPRMQQGAPSKTTNSSIVGLWQVQFIVDNQTIQEAYQLWNAGGTELHNPNVDPRGGNVCFGVWVQESNGSFRLNHRVWSYDTTGDFLGTIHLHEIVHLHQGGNQQTGSFRLDFYDPSGNFLMEVPGNVIGQRITVE